ncbi:MAG: hypothetical protein JKY37_15760 [Nannocystaceae bacterium]|nr:hypothetical protein [Nannocystaceae bacterium]
MLHAILSLSLTIATVAPGGLLSDPEAQAKLGEAREAFERADYGAAALAIEAAYLIEPVPGLLYPWAQAERQAGQCESAIDLYRRFIETNPEPELAEAARGNIGRCESELEDADLVVVDDDIVDEAEDENDDGDDDTAAVEDVSDEELFGDEATDPEPEPEPAPVVSTEKDDPPKAKKWYADPTGGVLAGLGIVGVGVGVGLLAVASGKAKKAADEDTNNDYLDARTGATKLRNGGAAALAIGSTFLLAGVIRYVVVAKKNKARTASIWIGPRGVAGVAWVGRF